MANVQTLEVPVESPLELGAIVGVNHVHAKRYAPEDIVSKIPYLRRNYHFGPAIRDSCGGQAG